VASNEGQLTAPAEITFEYADQDLVVRKTFRFDPTYVVNVETSVVYKGAEIFAAPGMARGIGDQATAAAYAALTSTTTTTLPRNAAAMSSSPAMSPSRDQEHQQWEHS